MAEEPSQTQSTPETTQPQEPMGNSPEVRNPDGTLKDSQTPTNSDQKPEPGKSEEAKPETGAPETYADFTAPEGYEIDKAALDQAIPLFKELNLTQAQAQKAVDLYGKMTKDAAEAPFKAWETTREGWRKDVISDPKLGNGKDGLNPEVESGIAKAIDSLGPEIAEPLREAMTFTGAGDNPAFIRAFAAIADRLNEGSLVTGRGPSTHGQSPTGSGRPTAAQAMYPKLPSAG